MCCVHSDTAPAPAPAPAHPPPPLHSELIPITIIKLRRGTLRHWTQSRLCSPAWTPDLYQLLSPEVTSSHPSSSQAAAGDQVEICRVQGKYWILTRHCIFVSHPPVISSSLLCAVSKLKIRTTNRRNALQHIMRYERSAV